MLDASLLEDPRLAVALPPSVIAYLRSAEGLKSRNALLDEYRKASPAPGFEVLLPAVIARTRATFKIMLQERVPLLFGSLIGMQPSLDTTRGSRDLPTLNIDQDLL